MQQKPQIVTALSIARDETHVVPIDVTDAEIRRVLEALPIGRLIARASSLTGARGSRDLDWPAVVPGDIDAVVWARVEGIPHMDLFRTCIHSLDKRLSSVIE